MNGSVFIPIPFDTVEEAQEAPSLTYSLNLDTGHIGGRIDGIEAVRQAIRKAIITPRFKCLIYDHQYGSEIEDVVIAGDASREFVEASIEGFVKDALKPDTRILDVSDFVVSFVGDSASIMFTASTIYGNAKEEIVIGK